MDKNCTMDDKKIEINQKFRLHRLIGSMPPAAREYGMWIINGSVDWKAENPVDLEKDVDRRFEFFSLSHMFKGKGVLRIGSQVWELEPGDAILICPGDWHIYGAAQNSFFCEDAIQFCGRIPDFMRKSGLLRSGIIHFGTVRRLVSLVEAVHSTAPNAWLKANIELQQLLMDMYAGMPGVSSVEKLLKTIAESPPNHWWSVSELAELRGISSDRLRREFLQHTGVLPKTYLEHFKLRQAAEYLVVAQASVTTTATRFGYMDRYHFSRRFKHLFGIAPAQYRKMFSGSTKKEDSQ